MQPAQAAETIDDTLRRARELVQAGQFDRAVALCEEVVAADPAHREGLYTLAVARRYAGRPVDALVTITALTEIAPDYGRAWQERGHVLMELGRKDEALGVYQSAVNTNGALPVAWRRLAELNTAAGRAEAARFAAGQADYLEALPPQLQAAASLVQENRLVMAEQMCRAFLQKHGHHIEAMRLLAEIGTRFNAYDEAEFLLESCKVLAPENLSARYDYAKVLRKRQKFEAALAEAGDLRALEPGNPEFEMLYANENLAVGNFAAAMDAYETLVARMPRNPGVRLTYGHALKTVGRQADAIEEYRAVYGIRPDYGDAYWSLANLKTYRFADNEIAAMQAQEAQSGIEIDDRYHLCFALGKALEDRGDYAQAFTYYERGNRLKRDEVGYDWRRIHDEIEAQIAHGTPELFAKHKGAGDPAPDPIFILGLPRAGSTLLEQSLSSHSQVEGTMELPNILALAHKLDGRRRPGEERRYPANLADLTAADLAKFGAAFMADTRIHRKHARPFFIDKMPNNFRHIGLIQLILPNARIIDARRGAMSCCFSGFKQLFAEGQEFTYGLEEIGHYYADYVRLMDHWDAVLPGRVLRVQYEDVVTDLETQVRRLLDFCGLPFEEACLAFHRNDRAVRTASSEQVRKPIYTDGVDQWRHFSPWLDPLRAVLGPGLSTT